MGRLLRDLARYAGSMTELIFSEVELYAARDYADTPLRRRGSWSSIPALLAPRCSGVVPAVARRQRFQPIPRCLKQPLT